MKAASRPLNALGLLSTLGVALLTMRVLSLGMAPCALRCPSYGAGVDVERGRDLGRGPVRVPRAQPHDSRGPVIDSTLTVVLRGARTRMPPLFAMLLLLQLWYSVESTPSSIPRTSLWSRRQRANGSG